jgi:hypothetical protein
MTYNINPRDIPEKNLHELVENAKKEIQYHNAVKVFTYSDDEKGKRYLLYVCLNDKNTFDESYFVSNDIITYIEYC